MNCRTGLFLTGLLATTTGCRDKETDSADTEDTQPSDDSAAPAVDLDGDGHPAEEDCNDGDAAIYPGATEICDFVDNDCDGEVDEGAADASTWFLDADSDGYGGDDLSDVACLQPSGFVDNHSDCNDLDASINPAAEETCDAWDNDCDGAVDESDASDASTWTEDEDGDGYGGDGDTTVSCNPPAGYVLHTGDCDDTDPRYNPSALEADCTDPTDYNCDGSVGYDDADGDGFAACEDCDDSDVNVNENADEVCDSIDNDCDGGVDEDATDASVFYGDADGDGHGGNQFTAIACTAPTGYVSIADDCNDLDASSYPGAQESCDLADNDCDGDIDEGVLLTWYADADGDGYGDAFTTAEACTAPPGHSANGDDCDDTTATTSPAAFEVCDGVDNDCDTSTDEADAINATTWYADADGDGYGTSASTINACDAPSNHADNANDCDDASSVVNPGAAEICDSIDNDCDGSIDGAGATDATTWYADTDGDGYGIDSDTTTSCTRPTGYSALVGDCNDADTSYNPGATLGCDGTDRNCDGDIDNDGDADGETDAACGGNDCDDSDPASTTVSTDADCDGLLTANDCDDSDATASNQLGSGQGCPATHCQAILDSGQSTGSDIYWIDPDSSGATQTYCDMNTDGGGWTRVVNSVPISSLSEVQVDQATVLAGQGNVHNDSDNAWLGLRLWNDAAPNSEMMMKCSGNDAGTVEVQSSFQLDSQAPYSLTWNAGCFSGSNNGRGLTTTDNNRGGSSTNCASYSGTTWPYESHGWGWHNNCHCGAYWNGNSRPACNGANTSYGGTQSDYVQVFVR